MGRYYCPVSSEIEDGYFEDYCCDDPDRHLHFGRRWWFYRPQWYWHGWKTLLPVGFGYDEYGRKTIVLGWTITGQVVFALWICSCGDCEMMRQQTAECEWEERQESQS